MHKAVPGTLKKSANLSINSKLLKEAKALKINLSATLEQSLREEISRRKCAEWKKKNKIALQRLNTQTEEQGLFADKHRVF